MTEEFLLKVFAVYAITFVIASSSLFAPIRSVLTKKLPWLKIQEHKHFIECRMCIGFWVSTIISYSNPILILPIYGASYFLATQER